MKYIFLLLVILVVTRESAHSQTNLICNQSFENVNAAVFAKLNDAEALYSSHLHVDDPTQSLFDCWQTVTYNNPWQTGWDVTGVNWGVVPGLFLRYDGQMHHTFPDYPNKPFVVLDTTTQNAVPRAFVADNSTSGLTLTQNGNGVYGLDLSPPTTKFGENVVAHHGSNYMALFDFENPQWQAHPALVTELKYPLVEGVNYAYSMAWCKMNLLGYIKDTEGWDDVSDGKIEVYVCNASLNQKQKIIEIDVDDNNWWVSYAEFEANNSSTHLLIEFNPVLSNPLNTQNKIGGAFIDNLKLYEACETAENMCDNANYRRDLLDVALDETHLTSPYAYPHPDLPNDPPRMYTIRAYHLENVRRFEMKIYKGTMAPVLVRTIDLMYPESDYFWDGRNDAGELMPDDNDYKAVINAVSNDCFHQTNADERNFQLRHYYSMFDVWTSTNVEDGNTFINGLDNVHFVNVKIHATTGQLVHEFNLNNPPSSIGLSIPSLETYGGAQNGQIATGSYQVVVTVSNNCSERTYGSFSATIQGLPDSGSNSPYYNWSSVAKPSEFPCPFNIHYNHNYLTPMDCCEGNLYLHDVEIWNDWDVQIWDTIFVGPNVVFSDGVVNNLVAGDQIVLVPNETGVIVNTETVLTTGNLNCVHCKNFTMGDPNEEEGTGRETVNLTDSIPVQRSQEMVLFPNPASGDQEMTILAGSVDFDPAKYELVLSNSLGKPVAIKVTKVTTDQIRFKPPQLSAGIYYLFVESNGVQQTFSIVIR